MSIWNKFSALFRGTAHEGAQKVIDANALRILDQEIRDADTAQAKARDDMAGLVARRRMLETEGKQFAQQALKYEASARAAMAKGDEAIVHSPRFALIDGQSRVRGTYDMRDPEAMLRLRGDLRVLVSRENPPG